MEYQQQDTIDMYRWLVGNRYYFSLRSKECNVYAFGVYKNMRVVWGIAETKAYTMKKELQIVRLQRNI